MLVVIVGGLTTVAVALASVTVKFSGPSTTASGVVTIVKLNSAAPVARSAAVVFVAVTWIVPFGSVVKFDKTIPAAAVSPATVSAGSRCPRSPCPTRYQA